MDRQPVAVLGDAAQGVDIIDIELRVHAGSKQVHRQVHDVHVAGALAIAEQRPLDAVGAGHDAELRRRHAGAPVVVGMEADHYRVAVF